ncbi:MAG TPA: TolC family protein, partial [Candidatus Didemnitutus sp.]|nr:TolC family protein [Candidatus Didemnitutus sp.]
MRFNHTLHRAFALVLLFGTALFLRAQAPEKPADAPVDTTPIALPEHLSSLSAAQIALSDLTREKMTLNEAIQRALAKNYAIKISSFNVSIAQGAVTEQYGIFDPKLTGSYSYNESESPQLADPITGIRPAALQDKADRYNLGLAGTLPWGMIYSVSATNTNDRGTLNGFIDNYASFAGVSGRQPLLRDFGFGATTAQIRIAMTSRSISEWDYRQSIMDTITRVAFAYYDLNFAYSTLRSTLRARDLTAQLVSENEKRYRVGSMSEYDVMVARSRLASREDNILR